MNSSTWNGGAFDSLVPDAALLRFIESWAVLRVFGLIWAVIWLAHRVWQIYKIPREQLEEKLGLEIPPVPDISLGGIYPTSILLHWLGPRDYQTTVFNTIEVNGVKVGEFRHGDTSIEILGLMSGNCYSIRVTAFNAFGNSASAATIRVQTGSGTLSPQNKYISEAANQPASIRTTSSRIESLGPQPAVNDSPSTQFLTSDSLSYKTNNEVICLASHHDDFGFQAGDNGHCEYQEHITELTKKLGTLNMQKEEIDKQIEEDDTESKIQAVELTKERDRLKQVHREKEEASIELKRHGNHLDKLNRSAQSRKAAKEKQLQQKKIERQKITEDITRWNREIDEMKCDIHEKANERVHVVASKNFFVNEKRQAICDDQAAIRALEEDIHVKGIQIKATDCRREEIMTEGSNDGEQDRPKISKDRDEVWEYRYQNMQAELSQWRQELQGIGVEEQRAKEVLNWWLEKRSKSSEQFTPIPSVEFPSLSRNRSRRGRHSNSRTSTVSISSYQGRPASLGDDSALAPPYPSATSFFNMGNGSTMSSGSGQINPSKDDVDTLNAGALSSPAANELLPSYLFRDEDMANQQLLAGRRNSSGNSGNDDFCRRAVSTSDASIRGPNTPVSGSSRGGSILPSPHESMQNLHGYHSRSGTFDDNDHRSINSIPSSLHPSVGTDQHPLGPNKFVNLFSSSFGRQRGKSSGHEPPPLGTLKQGQSQSFEIDDIGGRRRRGSHGYWANPIGGLLARSTAGPGGTMLTSSGRRSRLNMFGSKVDNHESSTVVDQSSSSRPSSTYSHDGLLVRPSSESHYAMWPTSEGLPNRTSPLGTNWAPNSGVPWSHHPSRRSSIEHGPTSNLKLGTTVIEPDEYMNTLQKQHFNQAPIGTRPQSPPWLAAPKLNPAAPSFKTLFGRSDVKKTVKQEKGANKASDTSKERESDKFETDDGESYNESPPHSRRSRDAQSITTATSTAESYDSVDRSTSGTPSEVVGPSGTREPKESLMQKITRKSSSSKFNVPWSKDKAGGGLFSKRAGEPFTSGEIDEDTPNDNSLGKTVEIPSGTPQQEKTGRSNLSWPNIRRKSRKGEIADKSSEAAEDE